MSERSSESGPREADGDAEPAVKRAGQASGADGETGESDPEAGGEGEEPQISAEFKRAAQGGMVVRVPDEATSEPTPRIEEGDRSVSVGIDVPDQGRIDHHVVTDLDRVPDLDGASVDAVHYRRPRDSESRPTRRTGRKLKNLLESRDVSVGRHRLGGSKRLGSRSVSEADGNSLEERVRVVGGYHEVVGVSYTVPHPHPNGPVAVPDESDDRAEVLVVPDTERALSEATDSPTPPSRPDLTEECDPDVVVAPDTADGALLEAFKPEAMVVTNEHVGGYTASRAEEVGTRLGMPDTGEPSVVALSATGVGDSNLAELGEVPEMAREDRAEDEGESTTARGRTDFWG